MANPARMIELPEELTTVTEACVRPGKYASVASAVRNPVEQTKLSALRAALDTGIAELDVGLGVETTPDELMAEVSAEIGLEP